ncbi:MAG: hypothetical protein ACRDPO_05475 [Streptosporangiaceae bacterium]
MSWAQIVSVAAAFTWLGLVAGISVIEAPLKFRAPGVTLALGLSIGRLVFGVVTKVEAALLAVTAVGAALAPGGLAVRLALLALLAVILAGQILVLRPVLDRRAGVIIAGGTPPPSRLHLAYIAAEGVKLALLIALGLILARA